MAKKRKKTITWMYRAKVMVNNLTYWNKKFKKWDEIELDSLKWVEKFIELF